MYRYKYRVQIKSVTRRMIVVNASVLENILPSMLFGKSATLMCPPPAIRPIHRHTHSKRNANNSNNKHRPRNPIGIQPTPFGCMIVRFVSLYKKRQHNITFYLCAYTREREREGERRINKTACSSRRLPNLAQVWLPIFWSMIKLHRIRNPTGSQSLCKNSNFAGKTQAN